MIWLYLKIKYNRGLIIESNKGEKIFLDPELSSTPIKNPTLVTHAHSDHTAAVSGGSTTYLTKITKDLIDQSSKRRTKNFEYVELNESFEIGNFEVEYINAGHLLGAAQIIVREGNETMLYTGDFCPEDLYTINGAELPMGEIDALFVDSTYGDELIHFDDRGLSREKLFVWIMNELKKGKIPMINVGNLGGAQELISYMNTLAPNLPIFVLDKISKINQVFQKYGVKLNYSNFNENFNFDNKKCIIIVPRGFKDVNKILKTMKISRNKIIRCIITGQSAKYRFSSFDFTSTLSTHANFDELISFISEIKPKYIGTMFGYHEKFARNLKNDFNLNAVSCTNMEYIDLKNDKIRFKEIGNQYNLEKYLD